MPPRSAKKGPGTPGQRKNAPRAAKSVQQLQPQADLKEEPPRAVEVPSKVVSEPEVKAKRVAETKPAERAWDPVIDQKSEVNESVSVEEEEAKRDAFEEDDKGERLDLEDNEPEYDPEEDPGVEYDEREDEHGHGQEEVDEEEEEVEGDIIEVEEADGDFVDEEMEEDGGDEGGGDEDNEQEEEEEEHEDIVEREEHEDIVKERRKRKEFEVFVGGLEKDVTEEDLKKVFTAVGEVKEVRLMMNPHTKKNKGFAFLRFATVEQAKRAVSELKNPVINGKQCGVSPSQDTDTLFLGNICKTWTKEVLKEKLKHHGIEQFEDLILIEDSNNEGKNRGFAFLEFSSRADAMEAFKRLHRRDIRFGVDRIAKVTFADSFIEPDDEIMAQVKTVFIDGLPSSWDEDRVKDSLKKYGTVDKVELARDRPTAKRKDFGFVTFDSHDAAVKCAESINNSELGDGDNKVKVRARLSRPHLKGKGKHFPRDHRSLRGLPRGSRSWTHVVPPRRLPIRSSRGPVPRGPSLTGRGLKRTVGLRDRHSFMAPPERLRPLPPPVRSYDRRGAVASYPKSSSKRDYGRYEELLPPRSSRAAADYGSRVAADRRSSYRDEYSSRGSAYTDVASRTGSASRSTGRRAFVDEDYARRLERPPPSYRESRGRDYGSVPGSKRPYSALDDDVRYSDPRHSRARLDYGMSDSHYADAYADRLGSSHLGGYSSGRGSMSGQESLYGSRHGMGYGGSLGSSDVGMYSSSYGSDYLSRGPDVGGGSYSSAYSSRSLGSGYLGSGGSRSYY